MSFVSRLSAVFFGLAGAVSIAISFLVFIDYRKMKSFRLYRRFIVSLLLLLGMLLECLGFLLGYGYVKVAGLLALAMWSFGGIWIEFRDIPVPSLLDKATLFSILALPLVPVAIFLVRWNPVIELNLAIQTQSLWLNFMATAGLFLVWFVSFAASRLRSSYMFWTVSFVFFASASASLRFGSGEIWMLASSILYLAGTCTYIYTWVNHGQSS